MSKLIITSEAKVHILEIYEYLRDQTGDSSFARGFINELQEKCDILKDFPEIGTFLMDSNIESSVLRYLVHKNYIILYRYSKSENTSYVLNCFHSRRDLRRMVRKYM
nr:type II toxin-antitoxin system RelE/ParE family toxin [Clostridia bacterium]